jgi:RNA polymerase sigma-70 factor (ECF subfamily)
MPPSIHRSGASTTLEEMLFAPGTGEAPSRPQKPHEFDLVTRLRARDEAAFREIVERYASRIYKVSCGILRNHAAADEVTQEVFANLYFSVQDFGGRGSLYAWLYRIAVNECYEFLRKKRFEPAYPSGGSDDAEALRIKGPADRCTTLARTATRSDLLNKLLAWIPEEDRWLLISIEAGDFSLAELSRMTGLNENTIKVRLFLVRRGLVAATAWLRSESTIESTAEG